VLVIPSLIIFVYLLFETTKISQEKIRQQFALDSAAFIQMGDYTNFLNRTAYVNGAFPYRIFKQVFDCGGGGQGSKLQYTDDSGEICTYKMFYEAGNFPKYVGDSEGAEPVVLDNMSKWDIRFGGPRAGMNSANPSVDDELVFITEQQGVKIYIFWDPAIGFYKTYAQVYTILGSIEASQMGVFQKLTERMNFFRKSFYLNAATKKCQESPDTCGQEGLASSGMRSWKKGSDMKMHYIQRIKFWAKYMKSNGFGYDIVKTNPPLQMQSPGLFQLATVNTGLLSGIGRGYSISQPWDPGSATGNFFNVDLANLGTCSTFPKTCVHATISSQCPGPGNNCVWPYPTPKYQTRLYP